MIGGSRDFLYGFVPDGCKGDNGGFVNSLTALSAELDTPITPGFEALVFKDRGESAVLRGWRRGVVGEKLLAALG